MGGDRQDAVVSLSREQLYHLVWAHPFSEVADQFGMRPVALRKICSKLDVPLPHSSYWSEKARGRCPVKAALRPADLASIVTLHVHCRPLPRLLAVLDHLAAGEAKPDFEELVERFAIRLASVGDFGARAIHRDLKIAFRHAAARSGLSPARTALLRPPRPLALLNSLVLLLASAGCPSRSSVALDHKATVQVGAISMTFRVDELLQPPSWLHASPKSSVAVSLVGLTPVQGLVSTWRDEPGHPLEERLPEIALGIAIAAHSHSTHVPALSA